MNTFLACFLAVIFAAIAKDLMWRTLAQLWVARQMKRAGVRHVSDAIAPMIGAPIDVMQVQRQTSAFTALHVAAFDVADKGPDDTEAINALLKAAGALRCTLPDKTIEIIRTIHKREIVS